MDAPLLLPGDQATFAFLQESLQREITLHDAPHLLTRSGLAGYLTTFRYSDGAPAALVFLDLPLAISTAVGFGKLPESMAKEALNNRELSLPMRNKLEEAIAQWAPFLSGNRVSPVTLGAIFPVPPPIPAPLAVAIDRAPNRHDWQVEVPGLPGGRLLVVGMRRALVEAAE